MIFILIVKNHGVSVYAYRSYVEVIQNVAGYNYEVKIYDDDCKFISQISAVDFVAIYGPKTIEQRLASIEQRLDALSNTQIKIG